MSGLLLLISAFLFILAIILCIISFLLFKKRKNGLAIILSIIGLTVIIPPIYVVFRMAVFMSSVNNSLGDYDFIKDFFPLNQEFNEIYRTNKKTAAGMNLEIIGTINGRGKLEIIHPPYEKNEGIVIELENAINRTMKNIDWYSPECLIRFVPYNLNSDGKLLVKIKIF